MHILRKYVALMMAVSILLVSSMPAVSATACAMPGMDSEMSEAMQIDAATAQVDQTDQIDQSDQTNCYIECGCRADNPIDGMPHQLAPHAFSMRSYAIAPALNHAISMTMPAFTARLLPAPTPPPRSI